MNPSGGSGKSSAPLSVSGVIVSALPLDDQIYATGTLLSNNEVELRNEIPGRIVKLGFQEGTTVRKGDLLVKIDDDDLQAQLKSLKLISSWLRKMKYVRKICLTSRESVNRNMILH